MRKNLITFSREPLASEFVRCARFCPSLATRMFQLIKWYVGLLYLVKAQTNNWFGSGITYNAWSACTFGGGP
jgi:hypothetical protein